MGERYLKSQFVPLFSLRPRALPQTSAQIFLLLTNVLPVSKQGRGPQRETEPGMAFLTENTSFWDPSLVTALALKQVSVINNLKRTKEFRNRAKAVKQQCSDKAES